MKKLLSLLTLIFAVMLLATTFIATAADKTTDIPGTQEISPAYLNSWGDLGSRNHQVNETIIGVRPVMWVDKAVLKKQLK